MPATEPISATDEHVITQVAEHIAAHFALDTIPYDLRENEYGGSSEEDWEPDVTVAELLAALKQAEEIDRKLPDNIIVTHPVYPAQISPEGDEQFVQYDQITDLGDQWNTVFVALAEAVALRNASSEAMLRAISLRQQFNLHARG